MAFFSTFFHKNNNKISTIGKIIEGFLLGDIPKIVGVPAYRDVKELHFLLSSNEALVNSNQSNGTLGHLALTITPNTYFTLAGIIFHPLPPANPVPTAVVPPLSTGTVIATIKRTNKGAREEWNRFTNVNSAIKQRLLVSTDTIYYRVICNRYTGYGHCTTQIFLEHLYAKYGNVTLGDLKENERVIKRPYDDTDSIEVLFEQVEEGVEFLDNTNE